MKAHRCVLGSLLFCALGSVALARQFSGGGGGGGGPIWPECESLPPIDYNRDGVVSEADQSKFLADVTSGNLSADFNADGLLNGDDVFAYCEGHPKPGFTFHWQVGTGLPVPNNRDNATPLPVPARYDNMILYEQYFEQNWATGGGADTIDTFRVWRPDNQGGIIGGYHLMLCDNRPSAANGYSQFHTYTNWQTTYTDRMDALIANVGPVINHYFPQGIGGDVPTGPGVIDFESVPKAWSHVDAHDRLRWYELLEDIATPEWDLEFFLLVRCAMPDKPFANLTTTELDALAKCTWEFFARDYTLRVLDACKAARSTMLWGYYEVPIGNLQAGGFNGLLNNGPGHGPTHWEAVQGVQKMIDYNNEIAWLLREVDVFLPMIYAPRYVAPYDVNWFPGVFEPDCSNNSTAQSNIAWRTNITITEAFDVQSRLSPPIAPAKPVLAYYTFTYGLGTNPVCYDNPISSANAWTDLIRSWLLGCDGMVIWGSYDCSPSCSGCPCAWMSPGTCTVSDCTDEYRYLYELYFQATRWGEAMRLMSGIPEP